MQRGSPVAHALPHAVATPVDGEIDQRGIGIIALIFISIIVICIFAAFAPPLLALVGCIGTVIAAVVIGCIIGTCKSTYLDKSSGVTASDLEALRPRRYSGFAVSYRGGRSWQGPVGYW